MAKGIKRHPCLRPLSRDHLVALMGAQRLLKVSKDKMSIEEGLPFFLSVWHGEVKQHIEDEESVLPEFIKNKADHQRLVSDHEKLREYATQLSEMSKDGTEYDDRAAIKTLAGEAGQFLDDHIRWEERIFFPTIEKTNSEEEILKLLELTEEIEKGRERGKSCEPRKFAKKSNKPRS